MWIKPQAQQAKPRDKREILGEKRRRARRRINKIRIFQKDWVKGNKTIAMWNVQGANVHGGRFGEIVKLCKRNGADITFVTELNTFAMASRDLR